MEDCPFKVGDTIRFVKHELTKQESNRFNNSPVYAEDINVGEVFQVKEISSFGNIKIIPSKPGNWWLIPLHFELVKYKFNVGDRVRQIRSGSGTAPEDDGKEAIVTKIGLNYSREYGSSHDKDGDGMEIGRLGAWRHRQTLVGVEAFELVKPETKSPLFKIGDVVRCITPSAQYEEIKPGKDLFVTFAAGDYFAATDVGSGKDSKYGSLRMEDFQFLYHEGDAQYPEFKVGDKVTLASNSEHKYQQGQDDYGTITRLSTSYSQGTSWHNISWISCGSNSYKASDILPYEKKSVVLEKETLPPQWVTAKDIEGLATKYAYASPKTTEQKDLLLLL